MSGSSGSTMHFKLFEVHRVLAMKTTEYRFKAFVVGGGKRRRYHDKTATEICMQSRLQSNVTQENRQRAWSLVRRLRRLPLWPCCNRRDALPAELARMNEHFGWNSQFCIETPDHRERERPIPTHDLVDTSALPDDSN